MSNYKNLASTVLGNSGQTTDTSIVVPSTTAAIFPTPPFYATIMPTNVGLVNSSNSEIVEVTASTTSGSDTTFTVSRAQRGTSAISWNAHEAILSHAIYTQDMPFIDSTLSTPSSVAYVATDNIQTSAVTTAKIASGAVTYDKIDSETLLTADVTFAQGYGTAASTLALKCTGVVYFLSNFYTPAITSTDNTTTAFTLPQGWRPPDVVNAIASIGVGNICRLRVGADGSVRVSKLINDISQGSYVGALAVQYPASNA